MDEQQFQLRADEAMTRLFRALTEAGEEFEFEADLNNGALSVEFENPPAKFVVSPNSPVRQIWVSALTKSFKLSWDEAAGAFALPDTGQTLQTLLADVISRQIGQAVRL